MQKVNAKAWNAVIKARTALLIDQAFFGCLAMQLELVEDASVGTMAVDGVCLYYAPDFVLKLTEPELVGVVAHEVHHVAYKHTIRIMGRDPEIWNYAGDYVINADLKKVTPPFTLPTPHLYDPKYDGMGTEEVYERLRKELSKRPKMIIQLCSGGGSGKDSKGSKGKDGKPGGIDPTGCGGVLQAGQGPRKKDANGKTIKPEDVERDWEINVRMAVNVAKGQNGGTVPGYLERLVTQLDKPKVSWKDLLRNFIDGTMSKEPSWVRPNRRSAALGVLLPGLMPDALHHLVMKIDVSGSISEALARSMVSEAAGALDDGVCDKLTVAYFDTRVVHVDEYLRGDLVECKVIAGGGTDYRPTFEWLMEQCPDASAAVMLTDMYPCHSWDEMEDPGIPYFWGAFCHTAHLQQLKVPFGEVVHIDGA